MSLRLRSQTESPPETSAWTVGIPLGLNSTTPPPLSPYILVENVSKMVTLQDIRFGSYNLIKSELFPIT